MARGIRASTGLHLGDVTEFAFVSR